MSETIHPQEEAAPSSTLPWIVSQVCAYMSHICDGLYVNYLDLHYLGWLMWLFYPLVFMFLVPIVIAIFLYASSLFLYIYRFRHNIKEAYSQDFWKGAVHTLCVCWNAHGRIWHGYEVVGVDKIPVKGPALLVYYHGAIPIDLYYLMARIQVQKNRMIRAIGDRFLWKIPGWRILMDAVGVIPGTISKSIEVMRDGQLLAVAPGGVREAYFSDEYYGTLWNQRIGFAKLALEAQVPIIPVFTQNCREAFRSLQIGQAVLRRIYERTRLPIVPIYGGFPVKMRTFIGDPIPYDSSISPEELAQKVQNAVESLIERYQKRPGNILRGLLERFYTPAYCKV